MLPPSWLDRPREYASQVSSFRLYTTALFDTGQANGCFDHVFQLPSHPLFSSRNEMKMQPDQRYAVTNENTDETQLRKRVFILFENHTIKAPPFSN
ncbi:MAG: hypothetical protein DRO73_01165 [Candidatus Thorarchaeota archaeon]|nr:MAG: hypothetical protein DRO73_01165 [Candidatus Thorarchaeota archaeon]